MQKILTKTLKMESKLALTLMTGNKGKLAEFQAILG
jgi:hypothetical protein